VDPSGLYTIGQILAQITRVHDRVVQRSVADIRQRHPQYTDIYTRRKETIVSGYARSITGIGYPDIVGVSRATKTVANWDVKHYSQFGLEMGTRIIRDYLSSTRIGLNKHDDSTEEFRSKRGEDIGFGQFMESGYNIWYGSVPIDHHDESLHFESGSGVITYGAFKANGEQVSIFSVAIDMLLQQSRMEGTWDIMGQQLHLAQLLQEVKDTQFDLREYGYDSFEEFRGMVLNKMTSLTIIGTEIESQESFRNEMIFLGSHLLGGLFQLADGAAATLGPALQVVTP